jgi:hypothetical protein
MTNTLKKYNMTFYGQILLSLSYIGVIFISILVSPIYKRRSTKFLTKNQWAKLYGRERLEDLSLEGG